jgi:hypothetical protein
MQPAVWILVLVLVVLYLWLCSAIGNAAARKGRSGGAFFLIALLVSPVLAGIIVAALAPAMPASGLVSSGGQLRYERAFRYPPAWVYSATKAWFLANGARLTSDDTSTHSMTPDWTANASDKRATALSRLAFSGAAVVDAQGARFILQASGATRAADHAVFKAMVKALEQVTTETLQRWELVNPTAVGSAGRIPVADASGSELSDDVLDQISRLAALFDAGAVTAEEFAAKKAELLARL